MKKVFSACYALLVLGFIGIGSSVRANVQVSLVSPVTAYQPGHPFTVALHIQHDAHWHTYWKNAGTGYATSLNWELPPGWTASDISWPVPHLLKDSSGHVIGHGYEGETFLLVTITPPKSASGTTTLAATADWLMCADTCVPGNARVSHTLPSTDRLPDPDPTWAGKLAAAKEALPRERPNWKATATLAGKTTTLAVEHPGELRDPHFFSADGTINYEAPQVITHAPGKTTFELQLADATAPAPSALEGVVSYNDAEGNYLGVEIVAPLQKSSAPAAPANPTKTTQGGSASLGFLATLGLAFIGGLILNLMPCVFPVLGIKVLGFMHQADQDRRKVIGHGLTFSAGVLLSFWILAAGFIGARSGGAHLGWGFQLQSPGFVFTLAVVMLVFALSLSGVFEFGLAATGWGSRLQSKQGLAGSFFSGVLATVVATPCSAPFLAPALGATLALPAAQSFAVFTAIAVGLSAPYLLLSIFPAAAKRLPRPGAWMEAFKQFMAFPLYATTGYLLWVLAGQTNENGLLMAFFGLTIIATGVWAFGRWATMGVSAGRRRFVFACAVAIAACGVATGWPEAPGATAVRWQAWSPEAVAEATASGKTVYVDFTARWCATCQANKKLVFSSDKVRALFQDRGIVALKADWTNRDAAITAELAKWGRSAVPFNLVIHPGRDPEPLPEILTPGVVLQAVGNP